MMMRGVKICACLLVIVAVATILITPDPADDVPGVLHHILKLQKAVAVWGGGLLSSIALLPGTSITPVVSAYAPESPELLTLLCTRLC
jgi:hypothetical protein